ncbi:MAG: AraC family transcriptional regulator [Bacteroidales bacterium]|jgi:AraC-like DNA-binding protein|nr:AraC family transcriptional regulator [Bacteroidales bacterium]
MSPVAENNLNELLMDQLKEQLDPHAIRNFILSDTSKVPDGYTLDYPFIFDGIILGICVKGSTRLKINFKEYELREGSIITILPKQIIKPIEKSEDCLIQLLFLSFDFITDLSLSKDYDILLKMGKHPYQPISKEEMYNLLEFHTLIVKYYHKKENIFREDIIKSLLQALIMIIGSKYLKTNSEKIKKSSRKEELTERFFKLLMQHYKEERSVSFYADKLCLTSKYLSSTIKKITGHSILEWISEAVIIEAKTMLKTTDLTILQLSEELNFPNPSFFIRFFKQYTGTTPLKYRNS